MMSYILTALAALAVGVFLTWLYGRREHSWQRSCHE